ncbi:MAG: phenylalanine--tRNA ligase subunit beta [Bacillota bacterium]
MKVPWKWLAEYVDLPWDAEEAAKRLTLAGVKVEGVSYEKAEISNVVTAKVVEVSSHPRRQGQNVGILDTGKERFSVVSGAPGMAVGNTVLLAKPGSSLPGGIRIEARDFGGVPSQGMVVCSNEILYGAEHRPEEDIVLLPPGTPLGVPAQDVLYLDDHVVELELTVNFSHCLSILGVALEVSAVTGAPLRLPRILEAWDWAGARGSRPPAGDPAQTGAFKVELPDRDLCPRYVGKVVRGVSLRYSPPDVERKLMLAGMRPISAVVDATNYVMLETGQPLHAFDLDTLKGGVICARRSRAGESIVTLDGESHGLEEGTLVIADAEGPVAVAGVMGGGRTEVTAKTRNLLLESAYFSPLPVRRVSQRLRLRTEAAVRFEKGVDPTAQASVVERLAEVIVAHAGGQAEIGRTDCDLLQARPKQIRISGRDFRRTLGLPMSGEECSRILESLHFECVPVEGGGDETLDVTVPPRRVDVEGSIDLVEEVARRYGYDKFEAQPLSVAVQGGPPNPEFVRMDSLRDLLVRLGGLEMVTTSFLEMRDLRALGWGEDDPRGRPVALQNPLSSEESFLRTGLLPGLCKMLKANQNVRAPGGWFWEAGTVFFASPDELPQEARQLAMAMYGSLEPAAWMQAQRQSSFYELKGIVEAMLNLCGIHNATFVPKAGMPFHPGRSARVVVDGSTLGELGEIHPMCQRALDMAEPCFLATFSLDALLAVSKPVSSDAVPKFMPVERDLAVVVPLSTPAGEVLAAARETADGLSSVTLFDVYQKPPVPEGHKSLAMRLLYQPKERTLTEEDLSQDRAKILARLERDFGAKQRL